MSKMRENTCYTCGTYVHLLLKLWDNNATCVLLQ